MSALVGFPCKNPALAPWACLQICLIFLFEDMHTLPFLTEKWTVLPFLVSACGLFLFLSFRGGVAASRVSSRLSPVVAVFHPRCHLLSFSLLELHCGAYTTPVYSVSDELAHLRGHFRGGVVPLSLVFPPLPSCVRHGVVDTPLRLHKLFWTIKMRILKGSTLHALPHLLSLAPAEKSTVSLGVPSKWLVLFLTLLWIFSPCLWLSEFSLSHAWLWVCVFMTYRFLSLGLC